jgi:hypothetical protein
VIHLEGKKRRDLTLLRVPPAHKRDIALFKLICPFEDGARGGELRYNGGSMLKDVSRGWQKPALAVARTNRYDRRGSALS